MTRYDVIQSKRYRHIPTGRTASIYGANPWTTSAGKAEWTLEVVGWTIRDNNNNTVGLGRLPFATREEAQEHADHLNGVNA